MKACPKLMAAALALSIVPMALVGCSSGGSSNASASSGTSMQQPELSVASEAPAFESVGAENPGASSFNLTNKTGKDIKAVSVKPTSAAEYPASMLASGKTIANGETVKFNCPVIEAPDAEASASAEGEEAQSEGSDVKLNPMADIRIELADGTVMELHQVVIDEVTDASIRVSDSLAYLEYTSSKDNVAVLTLESEKAIAQKAAEAKAAEEKAAQEEEQAQTEEAAPTGEAAYTENTGYVDYGGGDANYGGGATYVDDSTVGSGNEAACVDDIVLNF